MGDVSAGLRVELSSCNWETVPKVYKRHYHTGHLCLGGHYNQTLTPAGEAYASPGKPDSFPKLSILSTMKLRSICTKYCVRVLKADGQLDHFLA